MGHEHDNEHEDDHDHHGHHHGPASYNTAIAVGAPLNIACVVIEAVFGLFARSLALLADAGHNLSDVLGLLLAWGAFWLSQKTPTARRTYGLGRSSIPAALANAIMDEVIEPQPRQLSVISDTIAPNRSKKTLRVEPAYGRGNPVDRQLTSVLRPCGQLTVLPDRNPFHDGPRNGAGVCG